ncbi:MAG: sensor domain-containing diguanylate cyclase [Endomicrobia bacterium]|nr:sensor domain-containing diguanylate cyclase [Endomicrobiia bacterium]
MPIYLLYIIFIFVELFIIIYIIIRSKNEKEKIISHYIDNLQNIIKITETLRSSLEIDKVFVEILNILSKKFGYEKVFIYLIEKEPDKISFRCIACPGLVSIEGIGIYSFNIYDKSHFLFNLVKQKNIDKIDLFQHLPELQKIIKSSIFYVIPIIFRDELNGLIVTEKISGNKDILPLRVFANECGVALENAKLFNEVQEISITDTLTGVYNRRYFEKKFPEEIELARRYKSFMTLCILDIDDFKHYNDTNGHLAGDYCLKKVAELVKTTLRSGDSIFRYGGEEFIILLPATNKEGAIVATEKVRKQIETYPFEKREKQPLGKITVSIGFAVFPEDAIDANLLIKIADEELYKAKSSGKNKVCYKIINDRRLF